jgi:hypothetical protein
MVCSVWRGAFGIDELVDDLFKLGLQVPLSHTAVAFQGSLSSQ